MLYPIRSKTRELISLDGLWRFKKANHIFDDQQIGRRLTDYLIMPVPSSYNEIHSDNQLRNHVGWVWYEKDLMISKTIKEQRIVIRFGSVTHHAKVFLNGQLIKEHKGGFTPFEVEINQQVELGENLLQVAVNNILDFSTLPIGMIIEDEDTFRVQGLFDFFNYAGIHRPVKLYTTSKEYLKDITVVTTFDKSVGKIDYDLEIIGELNCKITLLDQQQNVVAENTQISGQLEIADVKLWQPLNAYLYEMKIELISDQQLVDEYILPVGIRMVSIENNQFLINNKPFYFKGFGKHEDSHIHGRGFDQALNAKDINLIKWIGANSFRTAHYPYSEEMMHLAMKEGIVVIDEVPAVGLFIGKNSFNGGDYGKYANVNTWEHLTCFEHHQDVIKELVARDKNNPAVVMWSIANEAAFDEIGAEDYFQPLYDLTKKIDEQKRPITIAFQGAIHKKVAEDNVHKIVDVIGLNRYYGWYVAGGELKAAEKKLRNELTIWQEKAPTKPIIFTEYGADTISGFHDVYDRMFTEEYQVKFYETYHKVFDEFPNVIGEHAWNFADFEVYQKTERVQGNKKGVFTRERYPKMIATTLKARWQQFDKK